MGKKGIGAIIILLVIGLLGAHRLEPELRVYPLAMGFDLSSAGYQVYYDIPDLSVYTGEGKPMEETERIWSFQGTGNQDIEKQIAEMKKETPDMGHVQAIIFGSRLLADPVKYAEVLESFVSQPTLGSGAYVFFTGDLQGIMGVSAKKTDSLGEYLVDLLDKSPEKEPVLLQDLYNAYFNQEPLPEMMELVVEDDGSGDGNLVVRGVNGF